MDYPVRNGSETVGKVQLTQEGLYRRVFCRCRLRGSMVYRLVAEGAQGRQSLGILTPAGDGFGLDRRIPRKQLPEEIREFSVVPSHAPSEGRFIPVKPEEPFQYLGALKDAYMDRRDGQIGIVIPAGKARS